MIACIRFSFVFIDTPGSNNGDSAQRIHRENLEKLMDEGVTVVDPGSTWISEDTKIGQDTIIYPFTYIEGKNITPHKLRATYGTQLYNKTGDLYMVQECMGHSSPTTTELYIRGKKNKNAQAAAEIMTKILF